MSSQDVVVTLVNQDSDDLDFPGIHKVKRDEEEEEAESASEGDIEIENLVEDGSDTQSGENEGGDSSNVSNITFDVRKRTLIMLWQRTILEEFYRAGMTSASMQLHTLHMAAAEKTGLDCNVVKNWIRNRRRPAAIKSAERLAEKMNQGELSAPFTPPCSLPTSILATPITTPSQQQQQQQARLLSSAHAHFNTTASQPISGLLTQHPMGPPDPKRSCLDHSAVNATPVTRLSSSSAPILHPTPHTPPCPSPLLLLKVRVSGSGESDFYEVELPSISYEALLKACAEEVEVDVSQVAKIRKLPNVLVRRDRDVQRLKEGQELEVVLKDSAGGSGGGGGVGGQLNIPGFGTVTAAAAAGPGGLPMLGLSSLSAGDTPPLSVGPGGGGGLGLHQTAQQLNGLH